MPTVERSSHKTTVERSSHKTTQLKLLAKELQASYAEAAAPAAGRL